MEEKLLSDPHLEDIAELLKKKYKCHTALLYGSRAKGQITATSDYDVVGIRKGGKKIRIAKKHKGVYWDLVVHSEHELKVLSEEHVCWKNARVLFEKHGFGKKLLTKIQKLVSRPHKPLPQDEIAVLRVWGEKEIQRCRVKDIHGAYRRAELLNAMIEHYFAIRKKKYTGPKDGFAWLKFQDKKVYSALEKSLQKPTDLALLVKAAKLVYQF